MWKVRSIRHLTIGAALAGFTGYGFVLWMPTFLIRSHGLSLTEVGLVLALMSGIVGGIGTFTAGRLADVLARRDERWRAWLVAAGKAGYVPFLVAFFMVDNLTLALLVLAFLNLWCAYHYFRAGATLREDQIAINGPAQTALSGTAA
jgi:MFS family permease